MTKKQAPSLPLPKIGDHPSRCISCAYDLTGVDNRCPECGVRTDGEPGVLLIAGVPKVEDTNPWRRLAFVALSIALFVFSQGLFIFGNIFGFITMAWVFVVIVCSTIAIVVTSPAKKRSVERIAFSRAGIGRAAWGGEYDMRFIPWTGRETVRSKSIGAVWQRLTIMSTNDKNKTRRVFEAGFRCHREELGWVCDVIRAMSMDQPIPVHPVGNSHEPDNEDDFGTADVQ